MDDIPLSDTKINLVGNDDCREVCRFYQSEMDSFIREVMNHLARCSSLRHWEYCRKISAVTVSPLLKIGSVLWTGLNVLNSPGSVKRTP